MNGRLYMVKVTPAHGVPYYLIDDVGRGEFRRHDNYDTAHTPADVGDIPVVNSS